MWRPSIFLAEKYAVVLMGPLTILVSVYATMALNVVHAIHLVKFAVCIRSATFAAIKLALHARRCVLGFAIIKENAPCLVQHLVTDSHATNAAQGHFRALINALECVAKLPQRLLSYMLR
jgi:hypothetical protein